MTTNFILVSDDNYTKNLGICTYSVLHNMCPAVEHVRIFIMDCGITEENKAKLRRQAARFDNAEMIFFPISAMLDEVTPKEDARWHRAIYGRLFFPRLMEQYPDIDRLLYLDCDVIVDGSLTELFEMNMDGKVIAGVADSSDRERKAALDIPPESPYINSGVLVIDTARWNALDVSQRTIDYINRIPEELLLPDQDAINYILQGQIKVLPPDYNLMWMLTDRDIPKLLRNIPHLAYTEEEVRHALHHGKIYHYAAHDMWSFDGITPIHARRFIKYHNLSDWRGEKRKFQNLRHFFTWLIFTFKRMATGDFWKD
ncbi:MAG: glycosyltransferase family 8 protein [Clostridia bacterium]|nr:glycosyltransferase family 8 protein [Clostridia bacterium]